MSGRRSTAAVGLRVLGNVGLGLLRHPVKRHPGLRSELLDPAGNAEAGGDAPVLAEPRRQLGQALWTGQFLFTEHADRPAGLFEPRLRQVMRPLDHLSEPGICLALGSKHPGSLKLQHQPGQRVRQHVMHLPGEPLALGQADRPRLGCPAGLQFNQHPFRLLVGDRQLPGQPRHAEEASQHCQQGDAGSLALEPDGDGEDD